MTEPLSEAQLAELRAWPSPAIANAIETFDIRSRATGFMTPDIVCRFPEMEPIVGYTATCKIRASIPPGDDPQTKAAPDWWAHIESIPEPRIIVIQDLDQPPIGSFWGEVNGNIHKALGAVGLVTDGGVRDLDEVRELGFQFLSKEILVSPCLRAHRGDRPARYGRRGNRPSGRSAARGPARRLRDSA